MKVIKPGHTCELDDKITATVNGVWIDGETVKYQVSWWCGRDRKQAWVMAEEIMEIESSSNMTIGFTE